jgi:hypothetical protein
LRGEKLRFACHSELTIARALSERQETGVVVVATLVAGEAGGTTKVVTTNVVSEQRSEEFSCETLRCTQSDKARVPIYCGLIEICQEVRCHPRR